VPTHQDTHCAVLGANLEALLRGLA
jgi:hypothetical protein